MAHYLEELNEVQRAAVENIEGPMMIVAGAGSGKTRVLTYRMVHLINLGVDAFNILSLTFTNKAAREMRNRIEKLVGSEARNAWMGTFHSIFARILRIEHDKIGYPQNFTIYDSDDSKSLMKAIIKEENLNTDTYKVSHILGRISLAKNNFISVSDYMNNPELQSEDLIAGKPKIGYLYEQYSKRCFKAGAMDFDDLLLKTYQLFTSHPEVLNKYQQKFKFVMVDEYQDTNHIQYLIIRKLAAVNRNICVVGDDAQSIYAFRGANIKNILNYEKDYPDLKIFKLEQNYRSTSNIVNAAADVIKRNKYQLKKEIWTDNEAGNKIKVFRAVNDNEEGQLVANSIFEEKMNFKASNNDFAILYRTNSQSRAFEEALRRLNLDYKVVGGMSFYQRKEIKDLIAYLRMVINPDDEEALKRVINYPTRGIGQTTIEKITVIAKENDTSLWTVCEHINDLPFDSRVKNSVSVFANMIKSLHLQPKDKNAFEIANETAKVSGLLSHLHEDKSIEGIGRYENLLEMLGAVKEFSEREENPDKSLGAFMQEISLYTSTDAKDDDIERITMMTIHQAKGLEYPFVYVVGLEENLFPSQMSLQSREDLEEERRLFYVALTRAEKRAFLSYALSRFRWGQQVYSEPSRFIEEINPTYLDYQLKKQQPTEAVFMAPRSSRPLPQRPEFEVDSNFQAEDTSNISSGMNIEHHRFGLGKVVQVEGNGDSLKATIEFNEIGQKQILVKYARMRILK